MIFTLIFVYLISLVGSWLLIRDFEQGIKHLNADLFEVFLCIAPLFNTITIIVLLLIKLGKSSGNIGNKFFRLNK